MTSRVQIHRLLKLLCCHNSNSKHSLLQTRQSLKTRLGLYLALILTQNNEICFLRRFFRDCSGYRQHRLTVRRGGVKFHGY